MEAAALDAARLCACGEPDVVVYGCTSMLVVTLPGLTFVTPLERAKELKPLLDQLPEKVKRQVAGG